MARRARVGDGPCRARAHRPAAGDGDQRGPPGRGPRPGQRRDGLRQHDPPRGRGADPRRPRGRAPAAVGDPLERRGAGAAGEQGELGARRAHRQLPVGCHALRGGLQPLLARAHRGARRRPGLHPGPLVAGHLRPRVPRGAARRGPDAQLPRGGGRQRPLVVPAPVADAGLLAVPDRVDGPRADHGDLPGPLHEVPRRARHRRDGRAARSGRSWATARWTSPSRWAPSRWPAARRSTTWSSSSTATCSGSTARCAATARSSRSSRPTSAAPAGT